VIRRLIGATGDVITGRMNKLVLGLVLAVALVLGCKSSSPRTTTSPQPMLKSDGAGYGGAAYGGGAYGGAKYGGAKR
jgi:hypothetical protein